MRIITLVLDFLFQPRQTERQLRHLASLPNTGEGVQGSVVFLARYKDDVIHAVITENKYYGNLHATKLLSELVRTWRNKQTEPIVFVPIPLGKKRLRERGYNQVTRVLEPLQDTETIILESLLRRTKETIPQTSLKGTERQENVRGIFSIGDVAKIRELNHITLVLVDDVLTTGATMHEARATLAPHLPPSVKLKCLTFAH